MSGIHKDLVLMGGGFITFAFFLILLKLSLPRRNPLKLCIHFFKHHWRDTQYLFYIIFILAIIMANILESRIDEGITDFLGYNLTSIFLSLEGNIASLFQMFTHPILTYVFGLSYLYVFPVLGLVAIFGTYYSGEKPLARTIFWAIILNYILIIPFYIFMPVDERWVAGGVKLTLNNVSPLLIEALRPMSAMNNCFPSFHTSLAVTIAMIVSFSGNARLKRVSFVCTALVVLSTLYLGFHWLIDIFAGIIFAGICGRIAFWIVESYQLELRFAKNR